ncbi:alpha-L-fucosidase, partial [Bacteroidota bacterium]
DLRFGMFICYNIMSYGANWGEAGYDISGFNPVNLDCGQWAEAAVSAGMRFGLLTTKHHEGFCLWDSEFTDYDVASTPYKKDIVRQYVDAFREKGLRIGLYYSIWDSTHEIDRGNIGDKELEFIKGQITELLSNYGKIDYFVIDGWFWRMGHHEVPYTEIRDLIRELQPECLITDHTHLQATYHVDIPYYEGPFGAFPPEGNTMPSSLGHCSVRGNGWFWSQRTPDGLYSTDSVESIVAKLESLEQRYCNFMLNCMPNRDGLLDTIFIDMLNEIGDRWEADESRPPLPAQGRQLVYSTPILKAEASSGIAEYLIDASQYGTDYKHWVSDTIVPQTIVLDLGEVYSGLDILQIIPNHRCKPTPESALTEGNVLSCAVYLSEDNSSFRKVADGKWSADSKFRSINFKPGNARYIKIEIFEAHGSNAIIAEIDIGGSLEAPEQL